MTDQPTIQQNLMNIIARDLERTLEIYNIHLTTDDFNALHALISAIATRIRETGK
jgi:hypothetical protein